MGRKTAARGKSGAAGKEADTPEAAILKAHVDTAIREAFKRKANDPDNAGARSGVSAPAAPGAESGAGKRSMAKESIRVLERMNRDLLARLKEVESKRIGGVGQEGGEGEDYELSDESRDIIARVKDLHGEIDAAYVLKKALETDLSATQKELSEEKVVRVQLEARVSLLEEKAALGDQLREDISFAEEEQTRTFRRLKEVTSELERVGKECHSLAEKNAVYETRIKELQRERFDLEAEVLKFKERLAEMVSLFMEKEGSSS